MQSVQLFLTFLSCMLGAKKCICPDLGQIFEETSKWDLYRKKANSNGPCPNWFGKRFPWQNVEKLFI